MKILSYEFPYNDKVLYKKEEDFFQALLLLTIEDEAYGILEADVECFKRNKDKKWKIGKIHIFDTNIPKSYIDGFRKVIRVEDKGLFHLLQEEEKEVRKQFEHTPKLSISRIESIEEGFRRKGGYSQKLRIQFSATSRFFTVWVEEKGKAMTVTLKQKKHHAEQVESLWYPGWKKEFRLLMLQSWRELESSVVDKEKKEKLYTNTLKRWKYIKQENEIEK